MKKTVCIILLAVVATASWTGGSMEESSAGRSEYLAERGLITPAQEIFESSFIGKVDYAYPQPEGQFGVTAYTGHRQVSASGQEELIVIGLQGRKTRFEELPPLNLAFVIDKSGSMSDANKMDWVKESFDIFIEQVRSDDFVSLVVFDSTARVIFPSTRIRGNRKRFRQVVHWISPGGGTNLVAGLKLGYEQVMANFRKEYVNRVLFLTDGVGDSAGIFEMAESYKKLGINVSTIGLGRNFDLNLMRKLAEHGGGSSRFISDRERMVETFGAGLSRMAVPVAKKVSLEIELLNGVRPVNTWAYDHRQAGSTVRYSFPTIHLGDYETIVLRAGTMLHFAQGLKEIGRKYYEGKHLAGQEGRDLIKFLLSRTNNIKKEVPNAQQRLDFQGFDEELAVLDNYIKIFGGALEMESSELEALRSDTELQPVNLKRSFLERAGALFREMSLDLQSRKAGNIAVSGFAVSDGRKAGITDLLDEMAQSFFAGSFTMVERQRIDAVLQEQEMALSELMETTEAIKVGRFLSADYILTGTVIPMNSSVIIFSRIIDTRTTAVESAAQVVVPIDEEVRTLL